MQDSNKDLVEIISRQYEPGRDAETDEEHESKPRITTKKAAEAVHILQLYEEQAERGKKALIKIFTSDGKELHVQKAANMSKPSISTFSS